MARKLVIPPYGEVRLRHFTARNIRNGGGGEIDFIAYSPKGILRTDDLNKNQFAGLNQSVTMWEAYCVDTTATYHNGSVVRRCWNEVLHYDAFFTDVNVGSDAATGGYVMAKRNSSKTCDAFVSAACMQSPGGAACMDAVIQEFLAGLQDEGVNKLAIALPVALGGSALLAAVLGTALWLRTRRRRAAAAAAAASEAAAKAVKLGGPGGGVDVESYGGGGGTVGVSKDAASSSSGSKDVTSSGEDNAAVPRGPPPAATAAGAAAAAAVGSAGRHGGAHGTADSFAYGTEADMGYCLGPPRAQLSGGGGGGGGGPASSGGGGSRANALVEGAMPDGTTVTFAVGSALGQGSYGVVFKGTWQDRPVAVKVIMRDRAYGEQVSNEVRLMTSEQLRHPNLLRAYAAIGRTQLMNRGSQGAQSLESALSSLSSAARNRSGPEQPPQLASPAGFSGASRDASGRHELAETWIISEYCDLGALAPHVHGPAKKFMSYAPGPGPGPAPPTTTTTTSGLDPTAEGPTAAATAITAAITAAGLVAAAAASGAGRRPRLGAILGVLRDIAAGMAHLHSLNVVHGDLKLANVLLCSGAGAGAAGGAGGGGGGEAPGSEVPTAAAGGEPAPPSGRLSASLAPLPAEVVAKVADFGLSRWLKEGQTHHSTKTVGTVTHMPPELLRSGKLTLSGDVYSFGIIMWELLTGSVPYKGLMYGEVVERVVVSQRRPEFPPHTPLAYRSLAERCWAADASQRPPFAAVLSELEALLAAAEQLQAESDAVALPTPQGSAVTAAASGGGGGAGGGGYKSAGTLGGPETLQSTLPLAVKPAEAVGAAAVAAGAPDGA